MTYSQLEYYYRNREKILEKNRIKAKELEKYNKVFNVKTCKRKNNKKIDLKVKHGKFIIEFN
tara:strand:- start:458 stop:643 length:186 start_codon:yes stop_codon:yes gene_type:complete